MKRIFILAITTLAFTGCTKDQSFDQRTDFSADIVGFSTDRGTRGMPVEDASELTDIGTFGYYTGQRKWTAAALPNRMFNRRLYRDGVEWKYEGTPVEWDGNVISDMYTFYAYAPYENEDNGIVVQGDGSTGGIPTLTYTVPADVTKQPDLMVAVPRVDIVRPGSGHVSLNMAHALTMIGFQVAGDGEQITGLSVSGVSMTGTLKLDGGSIEWTDLDAPPEADFSASINFDDDENYYTATPNMSTNLMKGDGYLMMIPQTLEDDAAIVISYADGTSVDINIDPHQWLPGKKIIYELTIVQGGVIVMEPSEITMPYLASKTEMVVDCSDLHGDPAPSLEWTLTSNVAWLTLSLNSDGSDAGLTISDAGPKTVYVFATENGTGANRTAIIKLNGEDNTVTTVRQLYSNAQRFARSNIVMYIDGNGNKVLTFAETEADHTVNKSVTYTNPSSGATTTVNVPAIAANVQGLHFRWGSLVGVTGNWFDNPPFNGGTSGVAPSHVVFWPTEYSSNIAGAWVFSEQSATGQVPYTGSSDIGANPNGGSAGFGLDAFAGYPGGTGPGFDKANAKGDICRYISDMGWVSGNWRMPTTAELIALLEETPGQYAYMGRVLGTWNGVDRISNTGRENKYGYFAVGSVRIVGRGVTGNELASNSLPNPGAAKVVFPASGYRISIYGGLIATGMYGDYWAATPGNGGNVAYMLDYNGLYNYHSYNMSTRANGYSVRCIME